jgi:hypothetical protein
VIKTSDLPIRNHEDPKVKDLRVGDRLTLWVREDQFGISPTLTERPLRIVKPTAMPK